MQADRYRKLKTMMNKFFLFLDGGLLLICNILLFFKFLGNVCLSQFCLYFIAFYIGQCILHLLILRIPKVDVIVRQKALRMVIGLIGFYQFTYLFFVVVFWGKVTLNPLYCMTQELELSFAFGLVFVAHFVVTLFFLISLIYTFISRKYYLLALGGFEVEIRNEMERNEQSKRIGLIEPDYPLPVSQNKANKYYQFEDNIQYEEKVVCSICLRKGEQEDKFIRTKCHHYFHRECIQNWAKVTSSCPECRTEFEEECK